MARYSDDERAAALAALAANKGNVGKTAREVGVPETTLRHWAKGTRHPEAAQLGEQKRPDLADACERLAWKLVRAMLKTNKIKAASLPQIAVTFGITVEKMRLLRNLATEIRGNAAPTLDLSKLTDAELDQYETLLDKAAPVATGTGASGAGTPATV